MYLFADAENNCSYLKTVSNFDGTIMVHFKAKYRKVKQSILIEKYSSWDCLMQK